MSALKVQNAMLGKEAEGPGPMPMSVELDIPSDVVKVFRTEEEIERSRDVWSSWSGPRDSDMDLVLTICRTSSDVLRPHVLVLYRRGKPVASLIGRVSRRPLQFRLATFNFFCRELDTIVFREGALRGDACPENCELLVRGVMACLENGEADVALLEHLGAGSALFRCAKNTPGLLFRDWFSPVSPHWKRELPTNLDELRASLSGSEKKRFRQIAKKLLVDFPDLLLVKMNRSSELEPLLQDVELVAAKAWQRKLGIGFSTEAALTDYLKVEAALGYLRVYILYLKGKPCAFWVGAVYQGTFYSDFIGYDPEYARYSPGTYMLSQMLEEFCSQGIRSFDFGFTDDDYKRRFGNVAAPEASLYLFPSTVRGFGLSVARSFTTAVNEGARTVLERTKLIQKFRRVWRRAGGAQQATNQPPSSHTPVEK